MGLNDTLEQLEAARAECVRLEAALEAAEQERDELRASLTELQPTSAVWRANRAAEDAKREADALAAVIERVREARGNHPECDRRDEGDPVSCGWKRAVQDIDAALRAAPAVSLAEHDAKVRAEAWDEGQKAGLLRADFEYGAIGYQHVKGNPYAKEQS